MTNTLPQSIQTRNYGRGIKKTQNLVKCLVGSSWLDYTIGRPRIRGLQSTNTFLENEIFGRVLLTRNKKEVLI